MNLKTLMLDRFIDVYVSGDTTKLFDAETPKEECDKVWSELLNEYYALVGGGNYRVYLRKTGRVDDTKAKIFRVASMYNLLVQLSQHSMTSPIILEEMRKEGYGVEFDKNNPSQYLVDLSKIPSRLRSDQKKLEKWVDEIIEATKEDTTSEQSFSDTIGALSQHFQLVINPTSISVWTYCSLIRRMKHGRT
jgi:hypothetical protein